MIWVNLISNELSDSLRDFVYDLIRLSEIEGETFRLVQRLL